MIYVYVLHSLSDPDRYYTGIAEHPEIRLKQHNAGEVSHTSKFLPWTLKNCFGFDDPKKAHAFERYLKSGSGRAFAKKHF
jgi:predicted GIY-YIG superfamily endonuclease